MGRVIILRSVDVNAKPEAHAHDGPYIDLLDRLFPNGPQMTHRTVTAEGETVDVDDYLKPIGDETYILALSPAGLDPVTQAIIIVVASVVLSVAATFLLAAKPPSQFGQETAGSVYSVSAQANQAKIGAPVPVPYGKVTRTPEYASQSYRVFGGNKEIRYFLLSLGAGELQLDDVKIGETPVGDLPPNLVEYEYYKPAQHTSTLGVIGADFGMHENVYTSGDVEQQELEQKNRYTDTVTGSTTSGASVMAFSSSITDVAMDPGDVFVISEPLSLSGLYTVASTTSTSVTIEETFPATETDVEISFRVNRQFNGVGPFVTNKAGTTTQKIEIDIEWPQGIYRQKDNGAFETLSIGIRADVQEIDDNGDDVGFPTQHQFSYARATNTPQRQTFTITKPAGRYKIEVQRNDTLDLDARDAHRTVWTGLKSYIDYDTSATVYGDTTILAVKIIGAEAFSSGSQQRIFATTQSILPQFGSNPEVRAPSSNLADVFADIYTNKSYGAGRPVSELDSAKLIAFRTANLARSGFNGVFDSVITVWDALEAVSALGRAKPFPKAKSLSLVTDEPKARKSIVTVDNMIKDTLRVQYNWKLIGDNDGVEVKFRDADTFEERYSLFPSTSIDPSRREVRGLTDSDEADELSEYYWEQEVSRSTEISFSTEYDALNFEPFDRVGVVVPAFNWGEAAQVLDSDGLSVTLNRPAPNGSLTIMFRDQNGDASDAVSATGDGSKVITLNAPPPITLVSDGRSVSTLCAFGLTADFVQDVTVLSIRPSGKKASVKAVNYVESL